VTSEVAVVSVLLTEKPKVAGGFCLLFNTAAADGLESVLVLRLATVTSVAVRTLFFLLLDGRPCRRCMTPSS